MRTIPFFFFLLHELCPLWYIGDIINYQTSIPYDVVRSQFEFLWKIWADLCLNAEKTQEKEDPKDRDPYDLSYLVVLFSFMYFQQPNGIREL